MSGCLRATQPDSAGNGEVGGGDSDHGGRPDGQHRTRPAGSYTKAWWRSPFALVVVVVVAMVGLNLWWYWAYRRGFPTSLDESGFAAFSLAQSQALHQSGLSGLLHSVETQQTVFGPLVPFLTVPLEVVAGQRIGNGYLVILRLLRAPGARDVRPRPPLGLVRARRARRGHRRHGTRGPDLRPRLLLCRPCRRAPRGRRGVLAALRGSHPDLVGAGRRVHPGPGAPQPDADARRRALRPWGRVRPGRRSHGSRPLPAAGEFSLAPLSWRPWSRRPGTAGTSAMPSATSEGPASEPRHQSRKRTASPRSYGSQARSSTPHSCRWPSSSLASPRARRGPGVASKCLWPGLAATRAPRRLRSPDHADRCFLLLVVAALIVVFAVGEFVVGEPPLGVWLLVVPILVSLAMVGLASLTGRLRRSLAGLLAVLAVVNVVMVSGFAPGLAEVRTVDAGGLGPLTLTDGRQFVQQLWAPFPVGPPGQLPGLLSTPPWSPARRHRLAPPLRREPGSATGRLRRWWRQPLLQHQRPCARGSAPREPAGCSSPGALTCRPGRHWAATARGLMTRVAAYRIS